MTKIQYYIKFSRLPGALGEDPTFGPFDEPIQLNFHEIRTLGGPIIATYCTTKVGGGWMLTPIWAKTHNRDPEKLYKTINIWTEITED